MKRRAQNIFLPLWLLALLSVMSLKTKAQAVFVENKGQWHKEFLYQADVAAGARLYVENTGFSYLFYDAQMIRDAHHGKKVGDSLRLHSLHVEFVGGQKPSTIENHYSDATAYNYFLGSDQSKWASNCKGYKKIVLKEVYEHIDFEFYEKNGLLKYNFIVHPGGDYRNIKLRYSGADNLKLKEGTLIVKTSLGKIREMPPYVFQKDELDPIQTVYKLDGDVLSFDVQERISRRHQLTIDPALIFSTFSGSGADNFGYTATYDEDGNAYAGGSVYNNRFDDKSYRYIFRTTPGAYMEEFNGGVIDVGISKYNPTGNQLLYRTFLGGNEEDHPHSMIVDKNGDLLIFGSTKSNDFPIANPLLAFDDTYNGGADIYLCKLSSDGSALKASTYVGGENDDGQNGTFSYDDPYIATEFNYADQFRGEIIVDELNEVYVNTITKSISIPKDPNQLIPPDDYNGYVFKINNGLTNLSWAKIYGGEGVDAGYGLDVGKFGELFVTGGTSSRNFQTAMNGMVNAYQGGRTDGFIISLDRSTGRQLAGTYIGTSEYDQSYFVKINSEGNVYVFGQTEGSMPISPTCYGNPGSAMFIQLYNYDLKNRRKSTLFGNGNKKGMISPSAFLVDVCDRVLVSGWGGATNVGLNGKSGGYYINGFPLKDRVIPKSSDPSDFYLAAFSPYLEDLVFGTYFGGDLTGNSVEEHVDGGTSRFDPRGVVYQSVCGSCNSTNSRAYYTTPGAWSTVNNGIRDNSLSNAGCNNAIFKIDFELRNSKPQIRDSFYEVTATDILNFEIVATDKDKYDWIEMFIEGDIFGGGAVPEPHAPLPPGTTSNSPLIKQVSWQTACEHIDSDTLEVKVKVYDHGCPNTDSNSAVIKILVKPPPLVQLPDYLCLKELLDGSLEVFWDAFEVDKYFKEYSLYKISPNGDTSLLKTFSTVQNEVFHDVNVSDVKTQNYCYFLKAKNVCDMESAQNSPSCSVESFAFPVPPTEMVTATVVNDKGVMLVWKKSTEPDFYSYEVYRSETRNEKEANYVYLASVKNLEDTFYIDNDINVDAESFCYKIKVADKCGHISRYTARACNIVLTGEEPMWMFHLNWQDYADWYNGVEEFELKRAVDTGQLRPIVRVDYPNFTYTDKDLDYCWGGYYYQVTAFENTTLSDSHNRATSVSNTIYLIQPPHLYVPSAFTPNYDSKNDNWGIVPVFVKTYDLKVFNRWGELVYESTEKKKQWRGEYKDKWEPTQDVYIWLVEYTGWDNSVHRQKGDVTILR